MDISRDKLQSRFNVQLERCGIDAILEHAKILKNAKSIGDADAYVYESPDGDTFFIKSYRRRPWIVKALFSRSAIRNEYLMLQRIIDSKIARVPVPLANIDNDIIVCEFLLGAEVLKSSHKYTENSRLSKEFFIHLGDILRRLHDAGICHGDLRRANIMVLSDGTPALIDLATGVCLLSDSGRIKRLLFDMFRKADVSSMAKIAQSFYPELLENELLDYNIQPPWFIKFGRFFRHHVYRHIRGRRNK